ncbi:MAG: chemotaxis protein CheW [Oscillospiraceae bacterium]|nr:chemotaxis protein CheW [Oscillospiraceae bacterium]MDY6208205.1 chemotaxis protein CheW [Oscillospiraceae bacterium]
MEEEKYLTFELSGQTFAIEISCVKEILNGCGSISPVPEFPEYGKGVINLRGDIVPIIDMRVRFHQPPMEVTDKICVIVTESKGSAKSEYLGFIVDTVCAVVDFDTSEISPPPSISGSTSNYINGVYKAEGKIIMIIKPELMLTESMIEAIGDYMDGVQ